MAEQSYPSQITGGCLCASIRYTISFPDASSWPPYVRPEIVQFTWRVTERRTVFIVPMHSMSEMDVFFAAYRYHGPVEAACAAIV